MKRNLKRLISFLLILALFVPFLPTGQIGATSSVDNNIVLLEPTYTAEQISGIFRDSFYDNGRIMSRPDIFANFLFGGEGDNSGDLMIVRKDGKAGLSDHTGRVVVPLIYDDIGFVFGNWIRVLSDGEWSYLNTTGSTELNPADFEHIGEISEGLAVVWKNDKWGAISETGEIAIPIELEFDFVGRFSEGLAAVNADDRWGFIDIQGEVVTPVSLEYDWIRETNHGLAIVHKDGKVGVINVRGSVIIPAMYDDVIISENGFIRVLTSEEEIENWKYYNANGEAIANLESFDTALAEGSGLIAVQINDKWGYINAFGDVIVPAIYDNAWLEAPNLIGVRLGDRDTGKFGLFNACGEVVAPVEFDGIQAGENDLIRVQKDNKFGVINTSGEFIVPVIYDSVLIDARGLIAVRISDRFGYFNASGNMLIDPETFDYVGGIDDNGFIPALLDGKWGFLNTFGEIVIPISLEFELVGGFSHGLAVVLKNDYWGVIDNSGGVVIAPSSEFSRIEIFSKNLLSVQKDDKFGLIDLSGNIVIPAIYDAIHAPVVNGYAWIVNEINEEFLYGIIHLDPNDWTEPTPNFGDANGDGYINAADVTAIRRYIAAAHNRPIWLVDNPWFIYANADINGDGFVNSADVTMLRIWLVAPEESRPPLGPRTVLPDGGNGGDRGEGESDGEDSGEDDNDGDGEDNDDDEHPETAHPPNPFHFQFLHQDENGFTFQLIHDDGVLDSVDLAWFHISSHDHDHYIGYVDEIFTISADVEYLYAIGHDTGSNFRRFIGSFAVITSPGEELEEPYLQIWSDGFHYIEYGEPSDAEPLTLDFEPLNNVVPPAAPHLSGNVETRRIVFATHSSPPSGWSTQFRIRPTTSGVWGAWQNSGTFSNLSPATGYRAQARFRHNTQPVETVPSAESAAIWTSPNPPNPPTASSITQTSITLNAISAPSGWFTQYRRGTGTLQTGRTFSGLSPSTTYEFSARFAANDPATRGHSAVSLTRPIRTSDQPTLTLFPHKLESKFGNSKQVYNRNIQHNLE